MENSQKIQIVSCSGASNTGEFADKVARKLDESGEANMVCLAKVAVGDQSLINKLKTQQDKKIVVLDGCAINCAMKILGKENITITNIIHVNTTDFGIIKGKTPVTDEKINEIVEYIKKIA
ncbi:MAG TPA: putative zinc-binding protein [Bacteroidales bacterium]|nr:putative zinc-binding protein [Bacteroidales bacterium]HOK74926.1 putative zinc-binding protein [Bacteroidales bacterium]HOM39510.1 putative zinc-binding protein [Bacteroidales bacterium]HOU30768.1 putative zinc-binding protein [Bacteroidales bacterium]HPP91892.1 putative zinc-binding protein [Bacteroidales bacterium]